MKTTAYLQPPLFAQAHSQDLVISIAPAIPFPAALSISNRLLTPFNTNLQLAYEYTGVLPLPTAHLLVPNTSASSLLLHLSVDSHFSYPLKPGSCIPSLGLRCSSAQTAQSGHRRLHSASTPPPPITSLSTMFAQEQLANDHSKYETQRSINLAFIR